MSTKCLRASALITLVLAALRLTACRSVAIDEPLKPESFVPETEAHLFTSPTPGAITAAPMPALANRMATSPATTASGKVHLSSGYNQPATLAPAAPRGFANGEFVTRYREEIAARPETFRVKENTIVYTANTQAPQVAPGLVYAAITQLPQGWPVTKLADFTRDRYRSTLIAWHETPASPVLIGWVESESLVPVSVVGRQSLACPAGQALVVHPNGKSFCSTTCTSNADCRKNAKKTACVASETFRGSTGDVTGVCDDPEKNVSSGGSPENVGEIFPRDGHCPAGTLLVHEPELGYLVCRQACSVESECANVFSDLCAAAVLPDSRHSARVCGPSGVGWL